MKYLPLSFPIGSMPLLACAGALVFLTGCCCGKPGKEVVHQRGWIGGQYKVVRTFPPELKGTQKKAVLITTLATNTPARLAGLAEGDLILELNHQPITSGGDFRRVIDTSAPGALLPVKAWHGGKTVESDIRVGRETFQYSGTFAIGTPYTESIDWWPNRGWSLIVLGLKEDDKMDRVELGSTETAYYRKCETNHVEMDADWHTWVAVVQARVQKTIKSQELVDAK